MGNIRPYEPKPANERGYELDFPIHYSVASVGYHDALLQLISDLPVATAQQETFVSATGQDAWQDISAYNVIGGLILGEAQHPTNVPWPAMVLPLLDEDGELAMYLAAIITPTGPKSEGSGYGGYFYRPYDYEIGLYDDGYNLIKSISSGSSVAYNYPDRQIEQGIKFVLIGGPATFPASPGLEEKVHQYFTIGADVLGYNPTTQKFDDNFNSNSFNTLIPLDMYGVHVNYIDVSESMGTESIEDEEYGGGSFDFHSEETGLPDMPDVGISTSGYSNVYKITSGELENFINELFPPFHGIDLEPIITPTDVVSGFVGLVQCMKNLALNIPPVMEQWINKGLIDFVIDCHVIPVNPTVGEKDSITVGWKTFTQTASVVTSDYVDVDCGDLGVEEFYGLFPDYLNGSQLFLPFVGFVPVQPEFFKAVKGKPTTSFLNVTYRFNVVDGSFMVYVRAKSSKSELSNSIVGQYSGVSCVHLPLTGMNYSSIYSNLMGSAVGITASVAAGNPIGVATSAGQLAETRPEMSQSNSYSSVASFMSYRRPYLLVNVPDYFLSRDYVKETGVPLMVKKVLGKLSGYTKCKNPVMDSFIELDDSEKQELKNMLMDGIYING